MKEVSTKKKYVLDAAPDEENKDDAFKVAVLDFGVKANILKCLQKETASLQYILTAPRQRRFWRISRMVYSLPMARETLRKRQKL